MSARKSYYAKIKWGDEYERRGKPPKTYTFETQAEQEAFLRGVSEAIEWSDYTMSVDKESHSVRIRWGEGRERSRPIMYDFTSAKELERFLFGVIEAIGWSDFTIETN